MLHLFGAEDSEVLCLDGESAALDHGPLDQVF
jgi:hypothetical protein